MTDKTLAAVKKEVVALAEMQEADLMNKERVDALVETATAIAEQKKDIAAQDTKVKDEFKRMCARYIEQGKGVICYSWDAGKKMTLTVKGGGAELDEGKLLKAIYDSFGEQVGDRGGRAWEAYCAISDPVEAPRVINEDKLAEQLIRAARIRNGEECGAPYVTEEIVQSATTVKAPTFAAGCSSVSKDEQSAHDKGELTEVLVVK